MTAIAGRLPFGLAGIVPPNLLGFAVINGFTFACDLALLTAIHGGLHWPVPVGITVSYGTASGLSYLLNRAVNFHSHGAVGRQVAVYIAVVIVNYLAWILGIGAGLAALGVSYQLARVIAGVCEAFYMYAAMRWLVFRDTRPEPRLPGPQPGAGPGGHGAASGPRRLCHVRQARSLGQVLDDDVHGLAAGERFRGAAHFRGDRAHRDAVAPDNVHLEVAIADDHARDTASGQIGADAAEASSGQGRYPRRGSHGRSHLIRLRRRAPNVRPCVRPCVRAGIFPEWLAHRHVLLPAGPMDPLHPPNRTSSNVFTARLLATVATFPELEPSHR